MFFATRDIKEVEEFWLIHFMMTTNMKDYIVENIEEALGKLSRDNMEGQFEHDLDNKSISNQLEIDDEVDTLQQRIEWWMVVVDRLGVIPNDVYDSTFDELHMLYRKAIDPEMHDSVNALEYRRIIP